MQGEAGPDFVQRVANEFSIIHGNANQYWNLVTRKQQGRYPYPDPTLPERAWYGRLWGAAIYHWNEFRLSRRVQPDYFTNPDIPVPNILVRLGTRVRNGWNIVANQFRNDVRLLRGKNNITDAWDKMREMGRLD